MQGKAANHTKDTLSIVIVGCGKVGHTLTEQLVQEGHDITIVDTNDRVINDTTEVFDVMGICGNGASLNVLEEAGIEKADMITENFREICWRNETAPGILPALVFLRNREILVGRVCMQKIDTPMPELGIDILAEHRNNGFGPEAIVAFCNWYAEKYNLAKVSVRISKENSHSIHVFEKLGAVYRRSTTYLPADMLERMQQELPGRDFGSLLQKSVREYTLEIPIC